MIVKHIKKGEDFIGSFEDIIEYVDDAEKTGGAVEFDNIEIGTDSQSAILEMKATGSLNTATDNKIHHFVISAPEFEDPTDEELMAAGRHLTKALGYEDHQICYAVHNNTENKHLHIVINRVHPVSGKIHEPDFILDKAHYAMREVEVANDWHHDNGNYEVTLDESGEKHIIRNEENCKTNYMVYRDAAKSELQTFKAERQSESETSNTINKDAEAMEVRSGRQSFESFAKENLGDVYEAESWEQVHEIIGEYGVVLNLNSKGNGLVFSNSINIDESCNASSVGRSLSKSKLEKRLGEYQPPSRDYASGADEALRYNPDALATRYKSEAVQRSEMKERDGQVLSAKDVDNLKTQKEEGKLYSRYFEAKEQYYGNSKAEYAAAMDKQKEREAERWQKFLDDNKELRKERLTGVPRGPERDAALAELAAEKAAAKAELDELRLTERADLREELRKERFMDYRTWLKDQAENHRDLEAEKALANMRNQPGKQANTIGMQYQNIQKDYVVNPDQIENGSAARYLRSLTSERRQMGLGVQIDYKKDDRTVFTDEGVKIRYASNADADLEAGILIANQKANGKGIYIVSGTSEFQDKVREIAQKHRIKIIDDDNEMAGGPKKAQVASNASESVSEPTSTNFKDRMASASKAPEKAPEKAVVQPEPEAKSGGYKMGQSIKAPEPEVEKVDDQKQSDAKAKMQSARDKSSEDEKDRTKQKGDEER